MKPGMEIGSEITFSCPVTEDMYAQFAGKIVHPAYSTVTMVYHMEWASRQIILPYLDDDEEGMGIFVKVKHLATTTVGTNVTVTATLTEIKENIIITEVKVRNEKGLIGIGEVRQIILPKKMIERKIAASKSF